MSSSSRRKGEISQFRSCLLTCCQQPNSQLKKKRKKKAILYKYNTYTKTRNTRNKTHKQDKTTIIIIIIILSSKHNTNFSQVANAMPSRCFDSTTTLTDSSPSHHCLHTRRSENIKQRIRYCTRLIMHDRLQPYRYRRNINSNANYYYIPKKYQNVSKYIK